jgi:cytochrome c-type biogenesis protein CcmF
MQRLWAAFAAVIVVVLAGLYLTRGGPVLAVFGFALAAWVACGALTEWAERVRLFRVAPGESARRAIRLPRAAYGMTVAHLGLAVAVAGFAGSAFEQERIQEMRPGDVVSMAGYDLQFRGVEEVQGANFSADQGDFVLSRGPETIAVLHPERRFFPLQQQTTAKTAIHTNFLADYYLALGDPDGKGAWAVRAYWKPLVPWIWIGAVIMAAGGVMSLSDRRWRVGAAQPARARPLAAPAE